MPSIGTVVLMGVGVVFVGLVSLIIICTLLGYVVRAFEKGKKPSAAQTAPATQSAPIENKQELIAAIAAAIAEDLGEDVSAIKILSIKKTA